MSPSASSSGASTSDGVATRVGASVATCSRIAAETICWMVHNRAGDSSSVEVSEEVLHHGGSATRPTTLRGGGVGSRAAGANPPLAGTGGILVTTCKALVLPDVSTAFCLFAVLLGTSIKTHVLNSVFP
ncbi:UNVERIFIED_CONTAM: hypothetical protein Slati_0134800 [Sesamum latifolium]|uniref:Uncharacterized protein n=1 Tax=Sesamum latifolium TaxID=2727402 RepID=A0AAW2YAL9_9LAMI